MYGAFLDGVLNLSVRPTRASDKPSLVAVCSRIDADLGTFIRKAIEEQKRSWITTVDVASGVTRRWYGRLCFILTAKHVFASNLDDSMIGRQVQITDQYFSASMRHCSALAIV